MTRSHILIILSALAVLALVAAGVFVFGYSLLIVLADSLAFLGMTLLVVLTALDLFSRKKSPR